MIAFETFKNLTRVQIVSKGEVSLPQMFPGVFTDSRKIIKGGIFCALKGDRFDGHDFVAESLSKGAAGAIVHPESISRFEDLLGDFNFLCGVPDTLKALQELANFHRRRFSIMVIAITGTNGKTSTKDMISLVLSQKNKVLKTPGNFNNQIGLPLTLFELDKTHEIAVVEMGANHRGEITELCRIAEPNVGVITNIGRGHLEYFGSIEGVVQAKTELLRALKKPAMSFLNGDDPALKSFVSTVPKTHRFGLDEGNDFTGKILDRSSSGCAKFQIGERSPIQLRVPGTGQVYNALAAYAVGEMFNVSHDTIKAGLESFTGSSLRGLWMEWKGIRIFNDSYNANPDSLQNALNLIAETSLQPGCRRIAVLGDMLELGEHSIQEHRRMGMAAAGAQCNIVYTYGKHSEEVSKQAAIDGVPETQHFTDKRILADQLKKKFKTAIFCC